MLRSQLQQLNTNAEGASSVFQRFRLEEDTVSFKVSSGAATGVVSLSLQEPSQYPRTGAFAFARGAAG